MIALMGFITGIAWCDHTFNPWIGCTKVSDGCKFCYAAVFDNRFGGEHWGPGATRQVTTKQNWNKVKNWHRLATEAGIRRRVFCASLADIFDAEAPVEARNNLFTLIEQTPNLDWLLLTKRPQLIVPTIPTSWRDEPRKNVWFGTSVEDDRVRERIDILAEVPAAVRFLSIEPMIGDIEYPTSMTNIHWAIYGGESGAQARRFDEDWARKGIEMCQSNNIAVFVKQMGSLWAKEKNANHKKGEDPSEWAEDLRIREFPGKPYALDTVVTL